MVHRVRRAAAVPQDLKEPWLEPLPILVPRQRTIQPDERLLHHVLGVVRIPEHRAGKAKAAGVVRIDDLGERVDVAELGAAKRS
jgi:hypothetical protein